MPSLSPRTLPTIAAVTEIAAIPDGGLIHTSEIHRRLGLRSRSLEHILQGLVRNGVLKGRRGARGGYSLGRSPGQISLLDIDEIVRVSARRPHTKPTVSLEIASSTTAAVVSELERRWTESLKQITLDALIEKPDERPTVDNPQRVPQRVASR